MCGISQTRYSCVLPFVIVTTVILLVTAPAYRQTLASGESFSRRGVPDDAFPLDPTRSTPSSNPSNAMPRSDAERTCQRAIDYSVTADCIRP